ncbi:hypothetical protein G6F22_018454 [Rhizopus arrhizus]|nr:hypothetical protein G6F22_018454 [Rhizopus arrhizus]
MRHSLAPVAAAKSRAAARIAAACGWFSAMPPTISTVLLPPCTAERSSALASASANFDGATICLPAMLKAKSKSTGLTTWILAPLVVCALRRRACSSGSSWRMLLPRTTMRSAPSISASGRPNTSAVAASEKSRLLMRWSMLLEPRPLARRASSAPSSFEVAGCTSTPRLSPWLALRISAAAARPSAQLTSFHSPLTLRSGLTARSSLYRPGCE